VASRRSSTWTKGTDHVSGSTLRLTGRRPRKIAFVQKTIGGAFGDLFVEHRIDAALHLAFCLDPPGSRREERINIQGRRTSSTRAARAR